MLEDWVPPEDRTQQSPKKNKNKKIHKNNTVSSTSLSETGYLRLCLCICFSLPNLAGPSVPSLYWTASQSFLATIQYHSHCQLSQLNAALGWDLTGKTAVDTRSVAIKFSASNKNSLSGNRSHSASKNIDSFLLQQGDCTRWSFKVPSNPWYSVIDPDC